MKPRLLTTAMLLAALIPVAQADGVSLSVPLLPAYRQECSACHVAYPPGLLGAASWRRLMDGLPKHYGSDASLDPATLTQLSQWLEAHSGRGRRIADAPYEDRITRSQWFVREHHEVPAGAWKRASIRSASNCAACHPGAADARYDEHDIRIPK